MQLPSQLKLRSPNYLQLENLANLALHPCFNLFFILAPNSLNEREAVPSGLGRIAGHEE